MYKNILAKTQKALETTQMSIKSRKEKLYSPEMEYYAAVKMKKISCMQRDDQISKCNIKQSQHKEYTYMISFI